MRKLSVDLSRYLPLVKVILLVTIAVAAAVAGGAPAIFNP